MDRKGQMITVDFVISLVLFTLAIGYVYRISEADTYRLKEEELFMDLQRIGTAAGERLVSAEELICSINGADMRLFNCLVDPKVTAADADMLGIPAGYRFGLWRMDTRARLAGLDPPAAQEQLYSETRLVLRFPAEPTKAQIESCINPAMPCAGSDRNIMLKVWKA